MDFEIPPDIVDLLDRIDRFIEDEIEPLQNADDNIRFFDHRRENARTDWDNGGVPTVEWEDLLGEMRRRADAAGFLRYHLPARFGGSDGSHLAMAVVREHLAAKGLGLHNDLQNESSVVGNFPIPIMLEKYGSPEQQAEFLEGSLTGTFRVGFGLTEPDHGSDATWMETTGVRDGDEWILNGAKMWNTGLHTATHDLIFARTSGETGSAKGITCFITPTDLPGFVVDEFLWTFNMPTDHARVLLDDV
ncbi:MAG: acyl-CoA/acyl-ACP dehydrogenase, partial [Acidimicrobiia bacterium]|nr:acyl-CoA/acyl-ACP dehydrogenase [Acidimicrobiia bacterium]